MCEVCDMKHAQNVEESRPESERQKGETKGRGKEVKATIHGSLNGEIIVSSEPEAEDKGAILTPMGEGRLSALSSLIEKAEAKMASLRHSSYIGAGEPRERSASEQNEILEFIEKHLNVELTMELSSSVPPPPGLVDFLNEVFDDKSSLLNIGLGIARLGAIKEG